MKFERDVERQKNLFKSTKLAQLESAVIEKRRGWLQSGNPIPTGIRISPRQAYESFFLDYLQIPLQQVPVIEENEYEIRWRSANPCPTLEACRQLGLDTRKICRGVYEKSTQTYLSAIDPELRFFRNYSAIRPYAPYCEEGIRRIDLAALMKIAIAEAKFSRSEGNKGYGALIEFDGRIIAQTHDTATTAGDPSLHAELKAIREACRKTGATDLTGAVLVSSCEPCPMCTGLAVWANVTTLVYGASIAETAQLGKARIHIPAGELIAKSPANIEVIGGILREECLQLYR